MTMTDNQTTDPAAEIRAAILADLNAARRQMGGDYPPDSEVDLSLPLLDMLGRAANVTAPMLAELQQHARTMDEQIIEARDRMHAAEVWADELRALLAIARERSARLAVDSEAGPWRLRVLDDRVARTTLQHGTVHVAWTSDGRIVGVEIIAGESTAPRSWRGGGWEDLAMAGRHFANAYYSGASADHLGYLAGRLQDTTTAVLGVPDAFGESVTLTPPPKEPQRSEACPAGECSRGVCGASIGLRNEGPACGHCCGCTQRCARPANGPEATDAE